MSICAIRVQKENHESNESNELFLMICHPSSSVPFMFVIQKRFSSGAGFFFPEGQQSDGLTGCHSEEGVKLAYSQLHEDSTDRSTKCSRLSGRVFFVFVETIAIVAKRIVLSTLNSALIAHNSRSRSRFRYR